MDATIKEEFNLANPRAKQAMHLLPGLWELQIGDDIVGDGVVLQEDYYEADFTSDEEPEGVYAADFTDNKE